MSEIASTPDIGAAPAAAAAAENTTGAGTPEQVDVNQLTQRIEELLAPKADAAQGGEEPKSYTTEQLDTLIAEKLETAKAEWEAGQQKAPADGDKKPDLEQENKALKAQLLTNELKAGALKDLGAAGCPSALAELLRYDSEESMKESLQVMKDTFAASLADAIKDKLKGKTPPGLGGAKAPIGAPAGPADRAKAMNAHRIIK